MTGHQLITPAHRSIRKYYENVAALRTSKVGKVRVEAGGRNARGLALEKDYQIVDGRCLAERIGHLLLF
jgi:hypothetical protein